MAKYDESGRTVLSTLWDAIQNIPEIIDALANLTLPASDDAWLYWDAGLQQFVFLEALAENVAYDNSASGLAATTVQEAIDELASDLAWGGRVAANGTAIGLPSGWSSSLAGSTYTVTHNLGFGSA